MVHWDLKKKINSSIGNHQCGCFALSLEFSCRQAKHKIQRCSVIYTLHFIGKSSIYYP